MVRAHEYCDCLECQKKEIKKEIKKLQAALSEIPFERSQKRVSLISKIAGLQARFGKLDKKWRTKSGVTTSRSQPNLPTIPQMGLDSSRGDSE